MLRLSDNNVAELSGLGASNATSPEAGWRALASALLDNTTLEMLDLQFNGLGEAAQEVLMNAKAESDPHRVAPLKLIFT